MDPQTETLVFFLTLFLVITKIGVVFYLYKKIQAKKQAKVEAGVKFLVAISIMILGLLVSRILFTYFDFVLTKFNENLYGVFPNYVLWKIAMFIATITLVYLLWVLDKTIMQNKFKGIPAGITALFIGIALAFRINGLLDFNSMCLFASVAYIGSVMIPGVFFYISKESSGEIRRTAFLIGFGILIYAMATLIVNEAIVSATTVSLGFDTRSVLWILSIVIKCVGLSMFAISSVKFVSE